MRMTLLDIGRVTGSVVVGLVGDMALFCPAGAAIDSRAVNEGDLFFCLPGERVDGHDFAAAAVRNGACAVVGLRNPFSPGEAPVPVFEVPDVVAALGQIASAHRGMTHAKVVGVTGTSGKTSVKEVLASVLGQRGETAKNPVNLNNQIGLPLSMLNAPLDAAFWVMEAGISQPHDMDELGAILRPDIAVVLNAGTGHTQGLGDKGVAHYKAKLLTYLAPGGRGVVSADYPDLLRESAALGKDIAYFSTKDPDRPYGAGYLGIAEGASGKFRLALETSTMLVTAPFLGEYGAENVAAIGAVAHLLALNEAEIANGFAAAKLPNQRFAITECGPFTVVDDSYNANPLSMGRMLDAAKGMADAAKKGLVLVLGEMGELGPESAAHHEELGEHAGRMSPVAIFWKGGEADAVRKGLNASGYTGPFVTVGDAETFVASFILFGIEPSVVLFKGSRSNKLEELVAAFAAWAGSPDKGSADAV